MTTSAASKIRVLIVDDSAFMRMIVSDILSADPLIEVVGTAEDGIEAVVKAQALSPDVITMDVNMPRMNGIEALRQIKRIAPDTKVIMLSSLTREGAKTTFEALEAGAYDYVAKSHTNDLDTEILNKVKNSVRSHPEGLDVPPLQSDSAIEFNGKKISFVGIGASTGGPVAVQEVLSRIPADFPYGIIAAIHMPKAFTGPYAERLNSKCAITVREAVDGDLLKPGVALIAPGGMHSTLVSHAGGLAVRTEPTGNYPTHVFIPSIDLMMSSMAEASDGAMLGVILTGMGNDGLRGMKILKQKGGTNVVQDEATSIIYGMPRACIEGGVADMVLPLNQIGKEIARLGGESLPVQTVHK